MKEPAFYRFIRRPLGGIFKAIYKPTIIGKRNIPEDGSIILAGNHTNYFDCILVTRSNLPSSPAVPPANFPAAFRPASRFFRR